ncbi:primosomal protein [Mycetocola manganoxydans]|uniref:Primosomal protein n=1 Tax=Mycetocola manganoxydans TaxID=699879 RepID=A0A3L6ZMJ4_9MICO|nr:primosomal protein [Mycetocola manganoxydans]RLP69083.1 primosomal protein [Mycetocola manganoxydans]
MSDSANDRDKRPERSSNDRQGGAPKRSDGGSGRGYSKDGASGARNSAPRSDRPRSSGGRDDRQRGDRPSYGDKPRGDRPSYGDKPRGDRPSYGDKPRGDRPSYGDRPRTSGARDDRPRAGGAGGDRKPRTGDRPSYGDKPRGDRPSYGDKPRGDRPSYGDKPRGDRPSYGDKPRGDRPSYGDKPRGDRPSYGDKPRGDRPRSDRPRSDRPARDGGDKLWTRGGAPARGDRDAFRQEEEVTEEQRMQRELRMVRSQHDDPDIPVSVTSNDLDRVSRNELKTLTTDNAERVARHLAMAAMLIDEDPELAHQHALSAARRAGRIGVVRETLAITAYETGDYALALRELRTHRRITGSNDQLPLMVDSERGVGRPERALELGRTVDRATLSPAVRVALSIAMSGARLDLGQPDLALAELQVPELNPDRAFEWSPELFSAQAEVLEELQRADEAAVWRKRADVASAALAERSGEYESETMEVFEILEIDDEEETAVVDEIDAESMTVTESTDAPASVDEGDDAEDIAADDLHSQDDASTDADVAEDAQNTDETIEENLNDAAAGQEK